MEQMTGKSINTKDDDAIKLSNDELDKHYEHDHRPSDEINVGCFNCVTGGRKFKTPFKRKLALKESHHSKPTNDVRLVGEVNPVCETDTTPSNLTEESEDQLDGPASPDIEAKNIEEKDHDDARTPVQDIVSSDENRDHYKFTGEKTSEIEDNPVNPRAVDDPVSSRSNDDPVNGTSDEQEIRDSLQHVQSQTKESNRVSTLSSDTGYESMQNSRRQTIISLGTKTIPEDAIETNNDDVSTMPTTMTTMYPRKLQNEASKNLSELERIIRKMSELSKNLSQDELARKRISLPNKFAAAYLTQNRGGYIGIDIGNHKRASLYIPPDALCQLEDPQLVYMYIPPPAANVVGMQSKEAQITPTIRLGPPGLEFCKPIFLTIPYKNDIDSTSMQILSHQKKKSLGNNWRPFPNQAVTVAQKEEVTILLNHFCDFGCTGISENRFIKVSTEVKRQNAENCLVFVYVCNVLHKHGDYTEMEIEENGGNIHVSINEIDKPWVITNKPYKEIEKNDLCPSESSSNAASSDDVQIVSKTLRVTFTAKLREVIACKDGPDFSATINVYQHNNHRKKINLRAFHGAIQEADTEIEENIAAQFFHDIFGDSRYFKCQDNYYGICRSLDMSDVCMPEQSWKGFGQEIGIKENKSLDWTRWLQSQRSSACKLSSQSPSALILDFFMKDAGPHSMTEKLQALKEIFVKIGNHEAKRYVELEIELRMGNTKTEGNRPDSGYISPSSSRPQSLKSVGSGSGELVESELHLDI